MQRFRRKIAVKQNRKQNRVVIKTVIIPKNQKKSTNRATMTAVLFV